MRMLLVQPPQGTTFGLTRILTGEPLGLECVGGALRARGHDAEILDLRLDGWDVLEHALADPPDAVGVSCSFSTDVYATLEIGRYVKAIRPDLPVVVGGHHASLLPQDFLGPDGGVDAVAVGEGEATAVGILDALARREPVDAVAGVLTRRNRGSFRRRPFERDLDRLPIPDRSLTARHRDRYHHGLMTRSASVETSRGCPYDCSFCSVWQFYERRATQRSAASIVRELAGLSQGYVFITDDLAFLDARAYRELAERLRASGIRKRYSAETRSDLVVKHRDLFGPWRAVGMDTVFLGVEKIDDAGLAAVRKRTHGGAGTNVEAIRILRGEGITPMTMFITDPSWGEEDFDRLEEFVQRLELPNPGFTVLTPLPGTELFRSREAELTTRDYGYYDVIHAVLPTRLPLERFYERVARLYDNAVKDVRPSLAMLLEAGRLALGGGFWCMRKVYGAIQEMRDPAAYLRPPLRVRAPDRGAAA